MKTASGTQHLNITVEVTFDDGKPTENYSQTVIMESSGYYYITDSNGEVRIFYILREQDPQTENLRSYYRTLVSEGRHPPATEPRLTILP